MKHLITYTLITLSLLVTSQAFAGEENIIVSESTYNPTHTNKFSFMMGFNPSVTKSSDLSNFAFSYGKKLENFWIDTNVLMSKGLFKKFSVNNTKATGATDLQLAEQQNNLMTVGLGIGRETRYAQTLLPFEGIYEFMAADLTYNSYKEDYSGKTFSGPGILAKFAVYKKFNEYFSAGAHFNYALAVVERGSENDTETSSDRSLTLGFLTVGFDISFYL